MTRAALAALALLTVRPLEAELAFAEPVWRADLGLSLPALRGAAAELLPLPKASAYLVTDGDGRRRLEDRFDLFDLWLAHTARAAWRDADGNLLLVARLATRPPADAGAAGTRRAFYEAQRGRVIEPGQTDARDDAAAACAAAAAGVVVAAREPVRARRAQRRNLTDLRFYIPEDDRALVCVFRPKPSERGAAPPWYLAVLAAAPGTDMAAARARFDEDFLDRVTLPGPTARREPAAPPLPPADATEEELLRADLHASVANHDDWHSAEADGVVVLDDLDPLRRAAFLGALTNGLPKMRRAYAARVPTALDATNQTALVRVFRSRGEYVAFVGEEHQWTGAVWMPSTRSLVLYDNSEGMDALLRTAWHEAFHQYLSYAGSMIPAAPWFNEGHAELFERSRIDSRTGEVVFERDAEAAAYVQEYAAELAEALPGVLEMDYEEFYSGTPEDVRAKYRLAWSVAYFLETGAPKLRFRPFEHVRRDYLKALVDTRDGRRATDAVFDTETRAKFIDAWLAFWKRQ